jgi:hypothetical protein
LIAGILELCAVRDLVSGRVVNARSCGKARDALVCTRPGCGRVMRVPVARELGNRAAANCICSLSRTALPNRDRIMIALLCALDKMVLRCSGGARYLGFWAARARGASLIAISRANGRLGAWLKLEWKVLSAVGRNCVGSPNNRARTSRQRVPGLLSLHVDPPPVECYVARLRAAQSQVVRRLVRIVASNYSDAKYWVSCNS